MPCLGNSRLACIDIVCSVAFWGTEETIKTWDLDNNSIEDVVTYCANKSCIADNPKNFCGGCTLYVPDEDGEDEEPWDMWLVAQELLKRELQVDKKGIDRKILSQSRPRAWATIMDFKFYVTQDEHTFAEVDEPTGLFGDFLDGEFNDDSKEVNKFLSEVRRVTSGEQESCTWIGKILQACVTGEYAVIAHVSDELSVKKKATVPTPRFVEVVEKWRDFLAGNGMRDRKERGEI